VKKGKPYYVDFLSVSWRSRFQKGLPKNHIFRRALGASSESLKVVDATAGFGQDALMILSMGCEVTAVERSKEVMSVLEDGIERARREDIGMKKAFEKLKIVLADTRDYLAGLKAEERPDVVYLDPMFDKPKKTAKSPKEMQLLQELLGHPPTAEEEIQLFDAAFKAAKKRVVVKRPIKAKALKPSPAHSYKGQSVRYDVYVTR
jgi:16S rRNA (guanine1516-N2)-methyltransferase